MIIKGNIVDVINERIFPGIITFGKNINDIKEVDEDFDNYILPGLIDSHIHIESSMLVPSRFAELAAVHGTVSVVADPHEIANVLGVAGINYMRKDARHVPLKFFFVAPSCVPATDFETSGARLGVREIEKLMQLPDVVGLGEVMNFPGVVNNDEAIIRKIEISKKYNKPIDGHCPGLTGKQLKKYVSAGISTEHECTSLKEAEEKAKLGMKIMIREGSSAKNLKNLISLGKKYECFLVSDDLHCDDLVKGHLNLLLRKAVKTIGTISAIKMITVNPSKHYKLSVGLLRPGDSADFVVVNNLKDFDVLQTWINGKLVACNGKALFKSKPLGAKNSFRLTRKRPENFAIKCNQKFVSVRVIKIIENQIITKKSEAVLKTKDSQIMPDMEKDILKISVAERYGHDKLSVAFINGLGLKKGAVASSIAHDSHNIVAVATNDNDMAAAVNLLGKMKGGLVVVSDKITKLELPVAGLMSPEHGKRVSRKLGDIHNTVRMMGCKLNAPFATLSFMALLVIPELKLSDKGLFDVNKFCFTDLFE